jgi:hypothetical protein
MGWKPKYRKPGMGRIRTTVTVSVADYEWVASTNEPGYHGPRWSFSELLERAIKSARQQARDKVLEEELARVEAAQAEVRRLREAKPETSPVSPIDGNLPSVPD